MPDSLTDRDGGLWHENERDWWSNGIAPLYAWSDDQLCDCSLNGGVEFGAVISKAQSAGSGRLSTWNIPRGLACAKCHRAAGHRLSVAEFRRSLLHLRVFD